MTDPTDGNEERTARQAATRERMEAGVKERLLERRARERAEDRAAARSERGLFTGYGRRSPRDDDRDDRDERSDRSRAEARLFGGRRRRPRDDDDERPRTGAKRSVVKAITQLPAYIRLLLGLISDSRVSKLDRFFVIGALAYIISPVDFIPDVIPFFGEVDDVFLLMIALQRLVNNAGRSVLLSHWRGDPDDVHNLNFARILSAAGFFLPAGLKKRLFRFAGLGRKDK